MKAAARLAVQGLMLALAGGALAGGGLSPAVPAATPDAHSPALEARPRHPQELRYAGLQYRPPSPVEASLKNGLRVWILEDRSLPLVEGVLLLEAGSIDDPPEAVGLARAVGQVLRSGGTLTRAAEEVDETIDFLGAQVSVSVSLEITTIRFSALSRDFDRVLPLLSDMVRNPAFRKDRLDLFRAQLREEIRRRWEDPEDVLSLRLSDLVYGPDSRWARDVSERSVDQIGQETCRSFHSQRYVPGRAWLGLAGDLDAGEARRKLERSLGAWRGRRPPPRAHQEPDAGAPPGVYWIERDLAQAGVAVAHLGARRLGPDHHALQVLNLVLGGGYASRLFKEVRTARGLAYRVRGGVGEGYDRGLFSVTLSTDPARAAEATEVVREVLESLREAPPSDAEVRTARERETHTFVFNFASPAGIVEERVYRSALGYPAGYLDTYLERIRAAEPRDLQRLAREYIRPQNLLTLVVGPRAAVQPLQSAGVEVRRLPLDPAP